MKYSYAKDWPLLLHYIIHVCAWMVLIDNLVRKFEEEKYMTLSLRVEYDFGLQVLPLLLDE